MATIVKVEHCLIRIIVTSFYPEKMSKTCIIWVNIVSTNSDVNLDLAYEDYRSPTLLWLF